MSIYNLVQDLPARRDVVAMLPDEKAPTATKRETPTDDKKRALDLLAKFIPAEVLAPFVTALSMSQDQKWDPMDIYVGFIVVTPLTVFLFTYAKAAAEGSNWPPLKPLIWRAIAAGLAFAIWGLSVPSNPLQDDVGGAAVAGFLAVAVSPVIGAVDSIVLKVLSHR